MHETEAINEGALLYTYNKCIEDKRKREGRGGGGSRGFRLKQRTAWSARADVRPSKCILSSWPFRHPRPKGVTLSVNECTITKQRGERHEYGPVRA